MTEVSEVVRSIQLLMAPVVIISATGLLGLAFYNRLAAIVSRARTFNKERFDVLTRLSSLPESTPKAVALQLESRYQTLQKQETMIIVRAGNIRNALICLLLSVFCMLWCIALLGASLLLAQAASFLPIAACIAFGIGLMALMNTVVFALTELWHSLDPVMIEKSHLDTYSTQSGKWKHVEP